MDEELAEVMYELTFGYFGEPGQWQDGEDGPWRDNSPYTETCGAAYVNHLELTIARYAAKYGAPPDPIPTTGQTAGGG